jgi:hypothetical protein
MNDNQNNIIVESLILQIETLKIKISMLEAKGFILDKNTGKRIESSSSGCSCQSEEEHYSGGCSSSNGCSCQSEEEHFNGCCRERQ